MMNEGELRRWMVIFAVASLCGIAAVLFLLWAFNGFHGLGIGVAGTVFAIFGIVVTSALGVALMGLVFYSDRSNIDEDVGHSAASGAEGGEESASAAPDGRGGKHP
jgi:di/tricarboxylate transporter